LKYQEQGGSGKDTNAAEQDKKNEQAMKKN
jgi:hypothetical protein